MTNPSLFSEGDIINPLIINTRPYRSENDIYIDRPIIIEFSEEMDESTLTSDYVLLTDSDFNIIPISLAYSNRVLTVTPINHLSTKTIYQVIIIGDNDPIDDSLIGVKDINGNPMKGNYTFDFTTNNILTTNLSTTSDSASNASGISDEQYSVSYNDVSGVVTSASDLSLDYGETTLGGHLKVLKTYPENLSSNIGLELDEIKIVFDNTINYKSVSEDGSILITCSPVNGDTSIPHGDLLGDVEAEEIIDGKYELPSNPNDDPTILPKNYTVSDAYENTSNGKWYVNVSDNTTKGELIISPFFKLTSTNIALDTLIIGSISDLILYPNCEYAITISSKNTIRDISGRKLEEDYILYFTSLYYPMWAEVIALRMKLGNLLNDVTDDSIRRYIFDATGYAYQLMQSLHVPFNIDNPPFYAKEYVKCKAALSLLDAIVLNCVLSFGNGQKTLGSFSISKGGLSYKDIEPLRKSLMDCINKFENMIRSNGTDGANCIGAVKAKYDPRRPHERRLWKNNNYYETPYKRRNL